MSLVLGFRSEAHWFRCDLWVQPEVNNVSPGKKETTRSSYNFIVTIWSFSLWSCIDTKVCNAASFPFRHSGDTGEAILCAFGSRSTRFVMVM